jgi:transposase
MTSERLRTESESRPGRARSVGPKRHWTDEEKIAIVRECEIPGSSVSMVSRRHDINSNLIFTWRRQVWRGVLGNGRAARPVPEFVPVTIIGDAPANLSLPAPMPSSRNEVAPRPPQPAQAEPESSRIEIELPNGVRVRFDTTVGEEALRRVLASLAVRS